ncbi:MULTISPECIES: DUF1525 domain-containing protein [Pseudomonas]|uniref:DUF1525 domain-containing protein n=1 Tax=Pseudomonas TaxID=286 RepID=UPI00301C8D88
MPPFQPYWPAAALFGVLASVSNVQAETWAITDSSHPLNVPPGVRLIRLDDQQRLEEHLSRSLPFNPQQATIAAQQLLNSPEPCLYAVVIVGWLKVRDRLPLDQSDVTSNRRRRVEGLVILLFVIIEIAKAPIAWLEVV